MKLRQVSRTAPLRVTEGQAIIELVDITETNRFNTGGDQGFLLNKYILEFDITTDNYTLCVKFVRNALNPKNKNNLQIRFV